MNRLIKRIVIHCSATPNGDWITVDDIDQSHQSIGFRRTDEFRSRQNPDLAAIGYHFIIYTNGAIATGRHLDELIPGANQNSLRICLVGKNSFTRQQWDSLKRQVTRLSEHVIAMRKGAIRGHDELRIIGHGDDEIYSPNPGFSVAEWLNNGMYPLPAHLLNASGAADHE